MSTVHPTVTDKDRGPNAIGPGETLGMIEDGEWHWFSIRDLDGEVKRAIVVPDGTYLVEVACGGPIIEVGPTNIEVNLVRYHFDSAGNIDQGEVGQKYHDSTAWSEISTSRRVKDRWFGTFIGKMVVDAASTSTVEAHAVGVDYRVQGGAYKRDSLILKFLRQIEAA